MTYDPDQPRDDQGQWSSGGGGSSPVRPNHMLPSFPKITSQSQSAQHLKMLQGTMVDPPQSEINALSQYQLGSRTLNNDLRNGTEEGVQAEKIRDAIDRQTGLDSDMIVYRGIPASALFTGLEKDEDIWDNTEARITTVEDVPMAELEDAVAARVQKFVGAELVDKAFFSTTFDRTVAADVGQVVLQITLPQGTKGVYLNDILRDDNGESNDYEHEQEFLLKDKSRIRINGVYRVENQGRIYLKAELI